MKMQYIEKIELWERKMYLQGAIND